MSMSRLIVGETKTPETAAQMAAGESEDFRGEAAFVQAEHFDPDTPLFSAIGMEEEG